MDYIVFWILFIKVILFYFSYNVIESVCFIKLDIFIMFLINDLLVFFVCFSDLFGNLIIL